MKKTLLAGFLLTCSMLIQASGISIAAGAYYWYTDAKGKLLAPDYNGYNLSLDEKTLEGVGNAFYFFTLEHQVPILPNFQLGHTSLTHNGYGTFSLDGYSFQAPIKGEVDLTHTDITLYYQLLGNIISLDLGITGRIFDGHIDGIIIPFNAPVYAAIDSAYLLLYTQIQFDIPATGLSIGATLQGGDTGSERAIDLNAYAQYTAFFGLGITIGYRHLDINLKSTGQANSSKFKITADFEASGPYAALHYRF